MSVRVAFLLILAGLLPLSVSCGVREDENRPAGTGTSATIATSSDTGLAEIQRSGLRALDARTFQFSASFVPQRLDGSKPSDRFEAVGAVDLANQLSRVFFQRNSGQFEAIEDGSAQYFRSSASTISPSTPWTKHPFRNAIGTMLGTPGALDVAYSTHLLTNLSNLVGDVRHVGSEEIRGRQATHYRVIPGDSCPFHEADIWLDERGRLARLVVVQDDDAGMFDEGPYRATVELFGFDDPLGIIVPLPDNGASEGIGRGA